MIPPKRDDMGRDKIGKVCKAMNSKKEQRPQQRLDVGRQVWDAASRGDLESLTSCLSPSPPSPPLLAEALNYQDPDFKRTPLFRACGFGGSLEVVRYLLSFPEVDPNLPSTEEVAPLSIACQQGHLGIVRALLADPRVKVDHLAQGLSPLYIACQWGKEDVVSALLEDGRIDPNLSLPNGTSPLYIACELNRGEVVKLLLRDPRVDVNRVRDSGVSPLFVACQEGHVGLVRQLLACPRVRVNIFSATRTSPLWIAGQNGHLEVVRWMLACSGERVDVEVPTVEGPAFWNGLNAAQQAERRGHHQIAALLREYEGDWQATRARLRLQLRLTAKEASETFSLMVLHSDGYLRVKPPGGCPCSSSSSSPCLSPSSRLDSSPSSPSSSSSCEASPSSSLSSLGLQDLCPTPDPSLCSLASPCSPCSSSSSLGLASYSTLEENQARFFAIGSRLPMELQMMLALRLHRLAVSHITIQDTDEAVRKVFTHT